MPLECSLLQKRSPLTNTKNRLLLETEKECERKYFTQAFAKKRPLETSFSLRSEHLTVNKLLSYPDVGNKFLKTESFPVFEQLNYQYEEEKDRDIPVMLKKKKKCLKKSESFSVEDETDSCLAFDLLDVLQPGASQPIACAFSSDAASSLQESYVHYRASPDIMPPLHQAHVARRSLMSAPLAFGSAMPMHAKQFIPDTSILNKMPVYHFASLPSRKPAEADFKSVEDNSELLLKKAIREKRIIKMQLLNAVSTSLLCSPQFKEADNPFRAYLIQCATNVVSFDPEFILKVALYTRQELNIRSTANFLLALAANENSCRPFLKKYFESSIVLPTDWISVAEMYLVFSPGTESRSLPATLRKVMKSSFAKFDAYQLAKYNRVKKSQKSAKKADEQDDSSNIETLQATKKSYTLKQLIRVLHITSPVEHVLAILGKKYPSDPESFRQQGLPGTWNSANAGKRMKLPVPETWETMISASGNKAEVWESLIDNSKLPYMATLRNLRNLILSDISWQHHKKVLARLSKKNSVIRSRQFPLRFFAAFKVLEKLEELMKKKDCGELGPRTSSRMPTWQIQQKNAAMKKLDNINEHVIETYKESLSAALEISANHNLDPIGGRTLVISDLTDNFSSSLGAAREFCEKKVDSCILLSLMCLKACEECDVKAILSDGSVMPVELKRRLFLENVSELSRKCESLSMSCPDIDEETTIVCEKLPGILENYLKGHMLLHQKLDNVIYVKSSFIDDNGDKKFMSSFLHKYRQLVNPDLLYIEVDLSVDVNWPQEFPAVFEEDKNNIYLTGFSEHIFKFIAERSNGGQLAYVENIDKKYDLAKKLGGVTYSEDSLMSNLHTFGQKISIYSGVPKWKTARIFISSTFKDMHGERDLLLRYVFPELKARAASLFVKINEIDLRWGITEADAMASRSNQLCLLEAQNCDIFIGILGERYGTRCKFDGDVDQRLSWVEEYNEPSITELEILAGALNRKSFREKAFFFIRNNAFMRQVPNEWREHFEVEDDDSGVRLQALKDKVRRSGMAVLDMYPCHFAGIYEGKPIVAGLDVFGKSVLNNLWNAVSRFYKKDDDDASEMSEEKTCHELLSSSSYFIGEENSPLNWIMKEMKNRSGIFVVTGKPGCGKTALIIRLLKEVKSGLVIPYFIGASSQSTDLSYMLCHIGNSVLSKLPLDISVPNTKESLLNNFPDIITEGSKVSFPGSLLLVIDGLDYLDTTDQTLDWLPHDLPQGFKLICSASDSSEAYRSLLKREKNGCPVCFVPMKPLLVADRQQLVRHYLKQHGKALDESPFNNQMLQLVTKADSGNPLYLEVACDYLKTFAVFENLMQKLQAFPSALNQVLEEIIIQMEKLHETAMVRNALILMCIVREGLEESELHFLLSIPEPEQSEDSSALFDQLVNHIISLSPECMIPSVQFYSLVHMLKTFAYPFGKLSHGSLRLASKEFGSVVMKYMKKYLKSRHVQKIINCHKLLAAYYFTVCSPKGEESWNTTSNTAFSGLLYHLRYGYCLKKLVEWLCCFEFLQAAFEANVGEDLPEYYEALLSVEIFKSVPISKDKIQDYANFVGQNMHVLKSWPFLIHQQALNEPVDSCVFKEHSTNIGLTLECVTRSSETLSFRPKTLDGFAKSIICVKSHQLDPVAVLGSEDGSAKVLNLFTGKIVSSLRGHSLTITSVCFLGRDRICLSSADNTLSIWSLSEHYRIAVLEGHTRFISSCCCDPQGNVVSSGWDCTVRFWSAHDGRLISCISNIRCPVNSVAHHPEQQLVACGLWNKTIEIWNAVSLSKKTTLYGHSGSVQCVVYSADGLHLLSSSLCLEVLIWSANECLQVAKLDGHTSFVSSISCSPRQSCIVTASDDTTLKVWPDEQQAVKMTIQEFKTHPVQFMEIVSQLHLAVAFQNSTICVFDLVDGHVITKLDTSSDPVSCFSKFRGGEIVEKEYCVDRSVEVLIYGTKSGKVMELKFENASVTEVGCLNSYVTTMHHAECLIFCGTTNGDIAVLSLKDNVTHGIVYAAHENTVTSVSATSAGMCGYLLSVSADKTVKLWEFGGSQNKEDIDLTPKLTTTYQSKHKDRMTSCCLYRKSLSPDARSAMVTGSYDSTVVIWNDEKELVLTGLQTSVSRVYYSGTYVVACGSEGTIVIWNQKGKCVSNIPGIEKSSAIIAFDFQTDKKSITDFDATLAFVENDGSISIRKPFQRSSLCTLQGHGNRVTSCDINKNDVVLSCSSDKAVNIWQLPKTITPNYKTYHCGKIKTLALSYSGNLALSGDEYGNLILWQITDQQEKHQMKYVTQKKYVDGIITAICWMKNEKVVCAVHVQEKKEEKHFIEIMICKSSSKSGCSPFTIQVQHQRCFSSEITAVDYLASTDAVAVGMKSGDIFLMDSHMKTKVKVANDWIVKVKFSATVDPVLFVAETDGMIKQFSFSSLSKNQIQPKEISLFEGEKSWITALTCDSKGTIYVGDTTGRIAAYNSECTITKQGHIASVSDMCTAAGLLFTCSLDRTVKIWNLVNLKQIGQFHSQSPISCLAVPAGMHATTLKSLILLFGTIVGDVHLLRLENTVLENPMLISTPADGSSESTKSTMFGGINISSVVIPNITDSAAVFGGIKFSSFGTYPQH